MNDSEVPKQGFADKAAQVNRKETTNVNGVSYDVVKLEQVLEQMDPQPAVMELSLADPALVGAVAEGNTYWNTEKDGSGEKLGPSHFIAEWENSKASNPDLSIDDFLEQLKQSKPEWMEHIVSMQMAKENMDRPIWLYSDPQTHQYPFDGMHRLTRAFLEGRPFIKSIFWDNLPDDARA